MIEAALETAAQTITGRQIRAARELLGWGQWRLAKAMHTKISTLIRFEGADGEAPASPAQVQKLTDALGFAGIEFGPGETVRVRPRLDLTGYQLSQARELLGWDEGRLGRWAGMSADTVRKAERWGTGDKIKADEALAIQYGLEMAGVEFLNQGELGAAAEAARGWAMTPAHQSRRPSQAFSSREPGQAASSIA